MTQRMQTRLKLILSFLFITVISANAQRKVIDKVIAVVGDKPILVSEIEEQKLQLGDNIPKNVNVESVILEEMMLSNLMLMQAEIDSIVIPEGQVTQEINQRIQYFASQFPGGLEDLEKFYGKSVQEIRDEFYIQIEDRLKVQQVQSAITAGVRVSPKEVKAFYNNYALDSIPLVGSEIEYAQIVLTPEITDAEKAALKQELEGIRTKIINNDVSFESSARFYSCDEGSAKKDGDFGMVSRGEFVPQFEEMAFSTPIDSVSPVFETQYGYHILKIEKRRGNQFKGRHILLCFKPSFTQLSITKKKLDSIRTEIISGNLTWAKAVEEFSDDEYTKGSEGVVYNQNSGTSLWEMSNLDLETYSAIDKIDVGEITNPFLIKGFDGQQYKIIKLSKRTKAHKANLKDDYQMLQKLALIKKESDVLEEWVNRKITSNYVQIDKDFNTSDFVYKWVK